MGGKRTRACMNTMWEGGCVNLAGEGSPGEARVPCCAFTALPARPMRVPRRARAGAAPAEDRARVPVRRSPGYGPASPVATNAPQ